MDAVKQDMELVGVTEKNAEEKVRWKRIILCCNAW